MTLNGRQAADDSFRDHLGIVSTEGKRKWIYPKKPSGRFHRARLIVSGILLAVLFGVPFIRIGGHPVMLFDIMERKFIIAGLIFGPHDFFILALLMITSVVFILLFTVVFGRLFCGWICPQTVFMEMVFRKIDYRMLGNHHEQKRMRETGRAGKRARLLLRQGIYFALSFLVANMLLVWIIGSEKLLAIVTDPPSQHVAGLTAILIFAGGFHWIFAWFREQACILVCPYGRLQGVLLDRNSIVIAYDHLRGEPRGKFKKNEPRETGDCIVCHQCVEVCPTGIDIRNGTQLECVNCTACIDECDAIMTAIGKPRGLIRYDSIEGIEKKVRSLLTPRGIGYSAVLLGLMSILTYFIAARSSTDVTILRTPGMFFQEQPDDYISNLYDVKVTNKTFDDMPLRFRLKNIEGKISVLGDSLIVKGQETIQARLFVLVQRDRIKTMNTPLEIEMYHKDQLLNTAQTSFLGQVKKEGK